LSGARAKANTRRYAERYLRRSLSVVPCEKPYIREKITHMR
jgi:hypothetical protein